MLRLIVNMLGGGALDRVLASVDRHTEARTNREAIKADIIKEHYRTRPSFMRAGGFILMMLFAVPLALWFGSVIVYSIFWCSGCAYPQSWSIAALPAPLGEWAAIIILAIFGVQGLNNFTKK